MKKISRNEFDGIVASGPTVVDVSAEWCVACKYMKPNIEAVSQQNLGVNFVELDADDPENRDLLVAYGISALPTVLYFKDGQVVTKKIGLQKQDQIQELVNQIA